jgi:hypothetical protein
MTFKPGPHLEPTVTGMLDQVIAWGGAPFARLGAISLGDRTVGLLDLWRRAGVPAAAVFCSATLQEAHNLSSKWNIFGLDDLFQAIC